MIELSAAEEAILTPDELAQLREHQAAIARIREAAAIRRRALLLDAELRKARALRRVRRNRREALRAAR